MILCSFINYIHNIYYWIFGIKERGDKFLIFLVPNRTRQTMCDIIITHHVISGNRTTIYSDRWLDILLIKEDLPFLILFHMGIDIMELVIV